MLQVVSELLSRHVLLNYDKFVEGITEIGLVEDDLQVPQHSLTVGIVASKRAQFAKLILCRLPMLAPKQHVSYWPW